MKADLVALDTIIRSWDAKVGETVAKTLHTLGDITKGLQVEDRAVVRKILDRPSSWPLVRKQTYDGLTLLREFILWYGLVPQDPKEDLGSVDLKSIFEALGDVWRRKLQQLRTPLMEIFSTAFKGGAFLSVEEMIAQTREMMARGWGSRSGYLLPAMTIAMGRSR